MTEIEQKAFANILRDRRVELGISARELARQAGIDNATITLLEQCKITNPRVETVRALALALQLPLADLYAAMNWLPGNELPSLMPYMRAKYNQLTNEDLHRVELFVESLSGQSGGPQPGEDE